MKPLRLLITNFTLAGRHGSVMYVHDLAMNLLRRGHNPVVYAPESGEVALELRRATVAVTDSLQTVSAPPDLIIGNTHPDTMCALLQFPGVPAIFLCHAWDAWLADAPKFPRLRRYVAVDETCRDWLVSQRGIPEDRVRIIYNGVDLERFKPREPLPEKPARAAVFSNHISETNGLGVIRAACQRAGLSLDVIGRSGGQVVSRPEEILRRYDLVFGKARCALEAMATGCAVITCDYGQLGCMVTSQNWPELRRMNFGRRSIRNRLDVDGVLAEIARFNRDDARHVSRCIRDVANLGDSVEALLALGREAIIEQTRVGSPGPEAELRAAGEYIRSMNAFRDSVRLQGELSEEAAQSRMFREHAEQLQHDNAILQREIASAHAQAAALEGQLRRIYESLPVRMLRKLPGLSSLAKRAVARENT